MKKWNIVLLEYDDFDPTENTNNSYSCCQKKTIKNTQSSKEHNFFLISPAFEQCNGKTKPRLTLFFQEANGCFTKKTHFPLDYIYSTVGLARIFKYIRKYDEAEKLIIVTAGHGSAYGIFKSAWINEGNKRESSIRGGDQILTNEMLSGAILKGFGKKAEVLIMFNCMMQNLHSWSAFYPAVKKLAAPEGTIRWNAHLFHKAISKWLHNYHKPEISSDAEFELVRQIEKYILKAKNPDTAFFMIDLELYPSFSKIFKKLILLIKREIIQDPVIKPELRLSRLQCFTHDYPLEYELIDFINWAELFCKCFPEKKNITKILNDLKNIYSKMALSANIGNKVYAACPTCLENTEALKPTGTAIHFTTKRNSMVSKSLNHNIPFNKYWYLNSAWHEFIRTLQGR